MKKQIIGLQLKRILSNSLLIGLIVLGFSFDVHANNLNRADADTSKKEKVVIEYTGRTDDGILFSINYENPSGNYFNVEVIDEMGNELFQEIYSDKKFSKKFLLNKDAGFEKLSFVIRSESNKFAETFNVKIKTTLLDDVIVTKN